MTFAGAALAACDALNLAIVAGETFGVVPNNALPTADFASPGASLVAALRPAGPPFAAKPIASNVPPTTLALVATDEPFAAGFAAGLTPPFGAITVFAPNLGFGAYLAFAASRRFAPYIRRTPSWNSRAIPPDVLPFFPASARAFVIPIRLMSSMVACETLPTRASPDKPFPPPLRSFPCTELYFFAITISPYLPNMRHLVFLC